MMTCFPSLISRQFGNCHLLWNLSTICFHCSSVGADITCGCKFFQIASQTSHIIVCTVGTPVSEAHAYCSHTITGGKIPEIQK